MKELKPRLHCELIKKWAEGHRIQFFDSNNSRWVDIAMPSWDENIEYRVKPQTPEKKYRPFISHEFLELKDKWIKPKGKDIFIRINTITKLESEFEDNDFYVSIILHDKIILLNEEELLEGFTFANGIPCGVEIKEE